MITEAKLPPVEGFVEQEINGERVMVETEAHVKERLRQEQLNDLLSKLPLLSAQIQAQVDRGEFIEDCIAEMAMQVYSNA